MSANEREKGERESTFLAISKFFFSFFFYNETT
jgi:hypothetical protein